MAIRSPYFVNLSEYLLYPQPYFMSENMERYLVRVSGWGTLHSAGHCTQLWNFRGHFLDLLTLNGNWK